jgi:kumamolisin
MKRTGWSYSILAVFLFLGFTQNGAGQALPEKRHIVTPKSSVVRPNTGNSLAYTNLLVSTTDAGPLPIHPNSQAGLPPVPGLFFETPAPLACVYRLVRNPKPGCNPDVTTDNTTGVSGAIAIVDAFDNLKAKSDLAIFSSIFGLPPAEVTVVYASGTQPPVDPTPGSELESSLDLQ